MNFSLLLEMISALSVLVTAVAATVGVMRYFKERHAERRLRWQQTTVQKILQSKERLTFEELKEKYRSLAADHMKSKLGAEDITEEALRMILVDLCANNVVVQFGADEYSLATYLGQMEVMKEVNAKLVTLQETFFKAQLEFLSKQDASIREMVEHQKIVTNTLAPTFGHKNIGEVK